LAKFIALWCFIHRRTFLTVTTCSIGFAVSSPDVTAMQLKNNMPDHNVTTAIK
jgi:hypothetical protein